MSSKVKVNKPAIKFTAEEEIRLIFEVEKRPILWDTTNESYKRADLKPQVWADVAANVGLQYSGEFINKSNCLFQTFCIRNVHAFVSTTCQCRCFYYK